MEEVWITEQIVKSFGGFKNFLEFLPTEIQKNVLEGKRINDLPSDLLAKVLSYVDLKDIKNLFSVCKYWNNIINTKPHFWNPFIKIKLKKENLPDFNTFSFSEIETTMRCKMEWIFRKNFLHLDGKKLHRHNACCNLNLVNDGNTSILYYSPLHQKFNMMLGRYILKNGFNYLDVSKWLLPGKGKLKTKDWYYEGDMKFSFKEDMYLPHGDGKWTFEDDGYVLEGKSVAYEGEPRFIKRRVGSVPAGDGSH